MQVAIKQYKGIHGRVAETDVVFNQDKNQYLHFITMKRSDGKLSTTVGVEVIEENTRSFIMFSDFRKTVVSTDKRATEKAIYEQHKQAIEDNLLSIMEEAKLFYLNKGE